MNQGIKLFNQSIKSALIDNQKYLLKHPSYYLTFSKIYKNLKKQQSVREKFSKNENLTVPPILILSVTNDCNLTCSGCYACNQNRDENAELNIDEIKKIIDEAVLLGVSIILIAGGEPLLKRGILDIPKRHPKTLFVMFSNGLLIDKNVINTLKQTKNLIPVISIEGDRKTTDFRRGEGLYDKIIQTMTTLSYNNVMFGSSITLTSKNYGSIIKSSYLSNLQDTGCAVTFLIEYVPQSPDDDLTLESNQKQDLNMIEAKLEDMESMLVVTLPGNEERFGGCLAAGRGFLHISSDGNLEACPFAPYSDANLKNMTLKDALKSRLMAEIRKNHDQLTESRGGCSLNENRSWVETLMTK